MHHLDKIKWYSDNGLAVSVVRHESDWECLAYRKAEGFRETAVHFEAVKSPYSEDIEVLA